MSRNENINKISPCRAIVDIDRRRGEVRSIEKLEAGRRARPKINI